MIIKIIQGIVAIYVFFGSLELINVGGYALCFGLMGFIVCMLIITDMFPDENGESEVRK